MLHLRQRASWLLAVLLPAPAAEAAGQACLGVGSGGGRPYAIARVGVEADGRRWHARNEDFENDRRRDNALLRRGIRVIRFTYRMLKDDLEGGFGPNRQDFR